MIIDYEKRDEATLDEKLQSLAESVQRAFNTIDGGQITGTVDGSRVKIIKVQGGNLVGTIDGRYVFIKNLSAENITAGNIDTDRLKANVIEAINASIQHIDAGRIDVDELRADYLDAEYAHITRGVIDNAKIDYADVNNLNAHYASIDAANITEAAISSAWIDKLLVQTNLLANDGQVFTLDAIEVNASNITAGTLDIQRLIVSRIDPETGTVQKYMVHFDIDGSVSYEKLDGNIIAPLTITADKIVSESIMTRHITTQNIEGTSGWINLRNGTFFYGNGAGIASATKGISWDGSSLVIKTDSLSITSKGSVTDILDGLQDNIDDNAQALADYITTADDAFEDLQAQIDGAIETWYYEIDPLPDADHPTSSNIPASNWSTDAQKNQHLRDLYYNTTNGHSFRWAYVNNKYVWVQIEDADAIKALADAAAAQDTADHKRRVFVATPTPPYDIGDLWVQGTSGDIMRCKTNKVAGQSYAASDWVKASKYTDDSAAQAVASDLDAVEERVHTCETDIETNSEAIRLKANSSDVYTKTTVDGIIADVDGRIDTLETFKSEFTVTPASIISSVTAHESSISSLGTRMSTAESNITQNANGIKAEVKARESATNILWDTDVPSLAKVNAPTSRYYSNSGNTSITCSIVEITDAPETGLNYAYRAVCDGSQAAVVGRALAFYSTNTAQAFTALPLKVGTKYTATWWARCISGTGGTRIQYRYKNKDNRGTALEADNLTSEWKHFTCTVELESMPTDYNRIWFYADFPASTAGTVELCGFRLVAGDNVESYSSTIEQTADRISMVVAGTSTSSSLVLTDKAVTAIANQFEIKGSDNSTTVISGGKIQTGSIQADDIAVDAITIGARNLLVDSETMSSWYKGSLVSVADGVASLTGSSSNWNACLATHKFDASLYNGDTYIWSFEYKSTVDCYAYSTIAGSAQAVDSTSWTRTKYTVWISQFMLPSSGGEWVKFSLPERTIDISDLASGSGNVVSGFLQLYNRTNNAVLQIRHEKLEKGNRATDWSPAPEDTAATATNYITADSSGIKVHNAGDSSNYAHISSDGMGVYKSGNEVASFGDTIILGETSNPHVEMVHLDNGSVISSHIRVAKPNSDYDNYYSAIDTEFNPSLGTNGTVLMHIGTGPSGTDSITIIDEGTSSLISIDAKMISIEADTNISLRGDLTSFDGADFSGEVSASSIKVRGHDSAIGSVLSWTYSRAITTAGNDTYTQGPSLTLTAGTWVLSGYWIYNVGSSSGARTVTIGLSTSSGSANSGWIIRKRIHMANNGYAALDITGIYTCTEETPVYLKASSSMTYTTAATQEIKAVRIA